MTDHQVVPTSRSNDKTSFRLNAVASILLGVMFNLSSGEANSADYVPAVRPVGNIQEVHKFKDQMPTGVTISSTGRIFVNFPRWGDEVAYTVGELKDGVVHPYPSLETNTFDPKQPAKTFSSVQSVVVDAKDRLWVLDPAAPKFGTRINGAAKLVAFDLSTNQVVETIVIPANVALDTTYLNDVRFDLRVGKAGVAYITDSSLSGPGGIIVVDLSSGKSWRKLSGHPSTSVDPTFVPFVEGQRLALRNPGESPRPFKVASDGIALSADGKTLYYSALSSRHLFSVPTALLTNPSANRTAINKAVKDLGEKGASDGLEADDKGRIYASDYEHNSIHQLQTNGQWKTIASSNQMLWPDTLSVGTDGYLYFIANQLHRQAAFHEGNDLREKPYMLYRIQINAGPVLLK
jgi:sugar lactone lactonase YvrE